jgi:hypothetical protein
VAVFVARPPQLLDLAFVVNNSPSMALKREKLLKQFPRLIQALADPVDGALPSLRVAFLDGDMGTDGARRGDAGELQLLGGAWCGIVDPAARWLQTLTLTPANYTGDPTQDLNCLLGNLPQGGCVYQQLLQAAATSATSTGPAYLSAFVRKNAYLGLILISDEDDCSTFPNGAMFGPDIPTEASSLRCATRGHVCSGTGLDYPTAEALTASFADCRTRTDACPATADVGQPTPCSPLADVHTLAQKIKALKASEDMVLVTMIGGWPLTQEDFSTAAYKIAPVPNPKASDGPPTVYDLWPICYDPDHPASNPDPATGYDPVAASYGAKPGLRLSAFVDEFGSNGLKFSICAADWRAAINLGSSDKTLRNICLDAKLVDSDPGTPTIEPDCIVDYFRPKVEDVSTPSTSACASLSGESAQWARTRVPRCDTVNAGTFCWQVITDWTKCPESGQVAQMVNPPSPYQPAGTRTTFQCRVYPNPDAGVSNQPGWQALNSVTFSR